VSDDSKTQATRQPAQAHEALVQRHRRTAVWLSAIVVGMTGMAYAAVPLYRMFCQVTGYGGTPQIAERASTRVLERTIEVRFDANVDRALPWHFAPKTRVVKVKLGDTAHVEYQAVNNSGRTTKGSATFNVTPDSAGAFFNKIQCFCFTEQTLKPGETVDMGVTFFVDPAILDDPDASRLTQITLSYTFYPVEQSHAGAAEPTEKKGAGKG